MRPPLIDGSSGYGVLTDSNGRNDMAATAQEADQITHSVELYVEGCREGDAAKLREAFHPDSRMWGSLGGARYDIPISEMIAMVDGKPVDVDGSYQAQVTSVEQTDDVASVVLVEDGFWGAPCPSSITSRSRGSTGPGRSSTRPSYTRAESYRQPSSPAGRRAMEEVRALRRRRLGAGSATEVAPYRRIRMPGCDQDATIRFRRYEYGAALTFGFGDRRSRR